MSDVFISYSRKNSPFARKLIKRLTKANKDFWVDWEDIPLTSEWWQEIKEGIEKADNFVFIMSPFSRESIVCNLEVDYALSLGKRIVPIIYQKCDSREDYKLITDEKLLHGFELIEKQTIDDATKKRLEQRNPLSVANNNWQHLGEINWLDFRKEDYFDTTFENLIKIVETDLEYVKAHTRYLTRALEWIDKNQRTDLLLFGDEIAPAEEWLIKAERYTADAEGKTEKDIVNPELQDIQRDYIEKSRQEDTRRKQLARSAQASIVILAIVLIFGFIGATFIVSQTQGQVIEGQSTLGAVNTLVSDAFVTVTQASIAQDISIRFANSMLEQSSNSDVQLLRINNLIEDYPDESLAYQALGLFFAGELDFEEALINFNRAIELDPQRVEAYISRGNIYRKQENYEAAIDDYSQAIELDSQNSDAYNNRGQIYTDLRDYQAALADFNQAIRFEPQFAGAYSNRGTVHRDQGDYQAAIDDYSQAIELSPQFSEYYNNRGTAYSDQGDYQTAIDDHSQAIELSPQYKDAYVNRGIAYTHIDDYEAAIIDYDQAIEIDSEYVAGYYNRGRAYYNLGNYDAALADFEQAIRFNPQLAKAYNNRGLIYKNQGIYETAITDFDMAIELDPLYAEAYNNRGTSYLDMQNFEEALADFDSAIELNPEYIIAYFNRGTIHLNTGNFEAAIENFSDAIDLNPSFSEAYVNRGLAYLSRSGATNIDDLELALSDASTGIELENTQAYLVSGMVNYFLANYANSLSDFEMYEALGGILADGILPLRDEAQRIVNESE